MQLFAHCWEDFPGSHPTGCSHPRFGNEALSVMAWVVASAPFGDHKTLKRYYFGHTSIFVQRQTLKIIESTYGVEVNCK